MIERIEKPKPLVKGKKKVSTQSKKSKLQKKCDRLFQEIGRLLYPNCLVCPNPENCLHHYFPKSMSSALRYDFDNGIPVCQGCHFKHHNGNPEIHAKILKIKGQDWHDDLSKRRYVIVNTSLQYYIDMERKLQQKLDELE